MTERDLLSQLQHACITGDETHVVELLDTPIDINVASVFDTVTNNSYKQTALHAACRCGNYNIVTLLLSVGASPDSRNTFGATPLMVVIQNYKSGIGHLLLDAGADVNARNQYDETPLHFCTRSLWTFVDTLLQHGANVDAVDCLGNTYLHLVVNCAYSLRFISRLLDAGADVYLRNKNGATALDLVRERRGEPDDHKRIEILTTHMRRWTKHVHQQYLEIAIALAPLCLPAYVVLWTLDWLPQFTEKPEIKKIRLLERVFSDRRPPTPAPPRPNPPAHNI